MTAAMGEDSHSSQSSSPSFNRQDLEISSLSSAKEITEDLTTNERSSSTSDDEDESVGLINLGDAKDGKSVVVKPRAYQLEMFEESLERNIIVAMDTGSGKTHITPIPASAVSIGQSEDKGGKTPIIDTLHHYSAVLRILHELERMSPKQFIWLLAPTVSLCAQQFDYLQSQITSVPMKYLSGADGVDRWTEKNLWNAVLQDVKIVVSTYQMLLDALTHSFVRIGSLALIVFDEAHNCVGKHPGAKMMKNHYHPDKNAGKKVPYILGLTASPLMRSDPSSLNIIEETLDAICRTPKKHRSQLRDQVKLPVFSQVYFEDKSSDLSRYTRSIESLGGVLSSLNIREDPYIRNLTEENSDRSRRQLEKLLLNRKTWTHEQIKALYNTSLRMCSELGAWAADHYIAEVAANSVRLLENNNENFSGLWDVAQTEKQYLANALAKVEITRTESNLPTVMLVSDKVTKLVGTLASQSPDFRGIIFVLERATAEVLARLLRVHPQTRDLFRIGTMVGTSTSHHRGRNIADVVDMEAQKHVLSRFRTGEINLVVATSVLEEGIDVPACNVVLCFQKPANLKSFVQRRGRARQKESKLILFLEKSKDDKQLAEFQKLEELMKKIYENDTRTLSELLKDEEEDGERIFRVQSTGALLELDNAVSHLHHFCATLPAKEYVDLRPEFVLHFEGSLIRAKVLLPLLVDESVRTAESLTAWKSEKSAVKDVAFEAYIALYKVGLVNDNLQPLLRHDAEAEDLMHSTIDRRASIMKASEQLNPWVAISKTWNEHGRIWQTTVKVDNLEMEMFLPVELPPIASFSLYWDTQTEITVKTSGKPTISNPEGNKKALLETYAIVNSAYGRRFAVSQKQQVMPFTPKTEISLRELSGQTCLIGADYLAEEFMSPGLIRDTMDANIAYTYKSCLPGKPPIKTVQHPFLGYENSPQDEPYISIKRLPRRNDFLHKVSDAGIASTKEHSAVLPLSRVMMDKMPFTYTQFALLLPSMLHRFGVYLLAEQLSTTILKEVKISNLELVVTAICASSAQEATNYQRIEFLGDSILKLCTSIQLMAEYPLWHEGLLSYKKDRFVSNGRLAKAALDAGIDKYIITKQFTANKWRPLYVEDLAKSNPLPPRKISSKILADVVEALIGAATLDGGIPKALTCLSVLLPELTWKPLSTRQSFLYQRAPDLPLPPTLLPLEQLLGYKFRKPSLLIEALTHASHISSTSIPSRSLERLEFLGDAILDNIIVSTIYPHHLSHIQMHLLRTAMVNADFLAWICLEWGFEMESTTISEKSVDGVLTLTPETKREKWPLWRFLRHSSHSLSKAQLATSARHTVLCGEIRDAAESGGSYPWALLSKLEALKFFSDMVESLIGAVWIDSCSLGDDDNDDEGVERKTSEDVVRGVLEKMGMMGYLRRILREGVHVLHPKEELGMLADVERVRYVVENGWVEKGKGKGKAKGDKDGEEVNGGYTCTVWVGEERICRVEGGVGKVEVKTKAAEMAVRILKERKIQKEKNGAAEEEVDLDVVNMDMDVEVGVEVNEDEQESDTGGVMLIDG